MVRSASPSIAGLPVIAPSADGGSAMPPAAIRSFSPRGDVSHHVARGGDAHHAHERRAGDPHTRYLVADGAVRVLLPLRAEGLGEDVAQEAEARKREG